ncbi:MAG: mycofactocin precursor [Deltaproteobacteria bacterium]|nr:mycofactocin precursor [Deltaproteobacteria bacterium]
MPVQEMENQKIETRADEQVQEQPQILEDIVLEEMAVDGICGIY